MEIWKDIPAYESYYEVSNFGRFRSKERTVERGSHTFVRKQMYIKTHLNATGYPSVRLIVGKHISRFMVHRLMAICFIDNPEMMPCINHLDGDKLNFSLNNLEWCTHEQNMAHAYDTGLANGAPKISISQFSKEGVFIKKFSSIIDACDSIGVVNGSSNIVKCARGKLNTAYGFKWSY